MRTIAFYLPQFHEIPENNLMWGKGFTEWTNVKKAKPLFNWHEQPVEPLNDNYYCLLNKKTLLWQVELAKKYGIYGFCLYHYWYNGKKLLEKPVDLFLENKDIDLPFCLCWANHNWTASWISKEDTIYFKQNYKNENDWDKHFEYLLPFFTDCRYMRNNGKPLLVIYEVNGIPEMNKMLDYWQTLAKKNGLPGIEFAYQSPLADLSPDFDDSRFSYNIEYQPLYARTFCYGEKNNTFLRNLFYFSKISFGRYKTLFSKIRNSNLSVRVLKVLRRYFDKHSVTIFDYDELWNKILNFGPVSPKSIPGAFVKMDTTPRRGSRGLITKGFSIEKFKNYFTQQVKRAKDVYHTDMIFVFAWNEWAEGGYLEPDKQYGYAVLESIKDALIQNGEYTSSD